ncbi:hypothetical protein [Massilia aerilata]|uniref:2-oxoisovalerate dehydrogenase E1 alpha subunit N-terminal domain-containing protein n=1 Tax=Massilia aerilata TaxID=453817 RepID=A0ABW0RYY4_9BURK
MPHPIRHRFCLLKQMLPAVAQGRPGPAIRPGKSADFSALRISSAFCRGS